MIHPWHLIIGYVVMMWLTTLVLAFTLRRNEWKRAETIDYFMSHVVFGEDPLVVLGAVLWPLALGVGAIVLMLMMPAFLWKLASYRSILVRRGLRKLNGGTP